MPIWKLRAYVEQMPKLRAEQTLTQLNIAAFPWMDEQSRRRLIRNLARDNNGPSEKPIRATEADLANLGIPVIRVKTDEQTEALEG